ncbi:MAG: hypothetical protein OXG62_15350 [Nitrospinae bacterium]|nr:hypothetical protein [Nitrospinota bacterium]
MPRVKDDSTQTTAKSLSQIHIAALQRFSSNGLPERVAGCFGFRALAPSLFGEFRDARAFGPYVNHDALRTREGEDPVFDVIFFRDINHEAQAVLARLAGPEARYDAFFRRKFRNLSAPCEAPARDVKENSHGLLQDARFEIKRFAVQYEDDPRITRGREFPNAENARARTPRAKSAPLTLHPEKKQKSENEK